MIPERGAFVVGVSRSGTTLYYRLLDGHPEVVTFPKETFLTDWCGAPDPVAAFFAGSSFGLSLEKDPERKAEVEAALRARISGPCSVREGIRALLEAYEPHLSPGPNKKVWIEKTPRHRHRIPVIVRSLGLETRVLCIVRDPRAVFASKAGRWADRFESRRALRSFAQHWAAVDSLIERYERQLPYVSVIRFEDLLADTEAVMRQTAECLGIGWDESLLHPTRMGEGWDGRSSFGEKHQSISSTVVARYRETLDEEQIAELERLLGHRMKLRGYELDTRGPGMRPLFRVEMPARWRVVKDLWRCRHDPPPAKTIRVRTRDGSSSETVVGSANGGQRTVSR